MFIKNGWITVDADKGIVYRTRDRYGNTIDPPDPYTRIGSQGYVPVTLSDTTITGMNASQCYGAHRIVWMSVYGDIPDDMVIDHINRSKNDNRIKNLRCVTRQQNARNKGVKPVGEVEKGPITPVFLRPRHIAEKLSIDVQIVYRAIYSGELPSYRFGKRSILVGVNDASKWIDANMSPMEHNA